MLNLKSEIWISIWALFNQQWKVNKQIRDKVITSHILESFISNYSQIAKNSANRSSLFASSISKM